eukprot:12653453-Ditylum_brightwellii.AAC.1
MEPTFCNEDERQLWYDKHSTRDLEDRKELDIRKVPTVYCESKFVSVLATHLYKAFSPNPPAKYMTKGASTAKVQTTIPSKVMVAGFEPGCFYTHK